MGSFDIVDVEQMVRLFNLDFNRVDQGDGAIFVIEMFGVQVVFNAPHAKLNTKDWWTVIINPDDNLEEKRYEVLWELVRGGYFHYLRTEYPNTYKKMFSMFNYDKRLVDERLRVYGSKPKYNYFRELNTALKGRAANFVMATDPGFYDFLQEA